MSNSNTPALSKLYLTVVLLSAVLLPAISPWIECYFTYCLPGPMVFGKWFIFWAVGIRLLLAGVRQITNPGFTAKEIFHIPDTSGYPIIKELGFANLCFGLVGIISLFIPSWRVVSAFASGLYYGLAAINHLLKKPATPNEWVALVSDVFVCTVLVLYVLGFIATAY